MRSKWEFPALLAPVASKATKAGLETGGDDCAAFNASDVASE